MIQEAAIRMIAYFDGDARRVNHALKVYGFAQTIGRKENLGAGDLEVLELSALLHDIGIKESERKYRSSAGRYQEQEGPPVARALLEGLPLGGRELDRVCYLIGHHHTYSKIDGVDFQILVEADFLVNIFEDEMDRDSVRTIQTKYFRTETGRLLLQSLYGV